MKSSYWFAFVALALAACGGGQTRAHPFERELYDDDGAELAAFVERWKKPSRSALPRSVVGAIDGRALVGRTMPGPSWTVAFPCEGQPFLVGDVAVALGGGKLVALGAQRGELLWDLPAYGRLRGASDDGMTTLVSIEGLGGTRTQVLAVGRDGTVVRQIVDEGRIGPPLVFDQYAFLPASRRAAIVFDLVSGVEAARVVARTALDTAFLSGNEIYLGDEEFIRFDADVVAARRGGGTRVSLPARLLPGGPPWLATPPGGPMPRAWVLARPEDGVVEQFAYVHGEFVAGMSGTDARPMWVRREPLAHRGGRATKGGFALCTPSGEAIVLDGAGRVELRFELGIAVDRCDVSFDEVPASPPPREALRLGDFAAALRVPRPHDLGFQLFLVDALAAEPKGTSMLRELATMKDDHEDDAEDAAARAAIRRIAKERLERVRDGRSDEWGQ